MLSGYVHSAVSFTLRPHLPFLSHLYSVDPVVHLIYCKLEVYVCMYMCSNVLFCKMYSCLHLCKGVFCMCMYVCQCVLSELTSSATKCCYVLLLFSCCHRNTVVAKLLLLPCYLISCSLFSSVIQN